MKFLNKNNGDMYMIIQKQCYYDDSDKIPKNKAIKERVYKLMLSLF